MLHCQSASKFQLIGTMLKRSAVKYAGTQAISSSYKTIQQRSISLPKKLSKTTLERYEKGVLTAGINIDILQLCGIPCFRC